ncbi:hypothetical protein MK280_15795 [Myxococcota bacterium]|nr:hypothetical protein [Myxococcota bacterium]
MWTVLDVAGHPRDLGEAQGRLLAPQIQQQPRALDGSRRPWFPSLRGLTSGSWRGAGVGREMIRHYTHLAERMDGLARGAGVSIDSILALHAEGAASGLESDAASHPPVALSAVDLKGQGGVSLARSLPGDAVVEANFCVRKSRPTVGFASVEIVLPWMCASWAGVNQAGLAACIVPSSGESSKNRSDPSPLLLVQECLQRFESVETAQDWAMNRPAWGWATLLLADASGDRVQVDYEGCQRRDQRALDEPIWVGDALEDRICLEDRLLSGETDVTETLEQVFSGVQLGNWVLLRPGDRALECRGKNLHFKIEM